MVTKSMIISDLELRLSAFKPSDDMEFPRPLISHWIDIARNAMVMDMATEAEEIGVEIDPYYLKKSDCLYAKKEVNSCKKRCKYIISFPEQLFKKDEEVTRAVILRITDVYNDNLIKVTYDEAENFAMLDFARPSQTNLMYYREMDHLVILGLDDRSANIQKFEIYYVANESIGENEEVNILDEDLPDLMEYLEDIARRALASDTDWDNDGADENFE